MYATVGTNGGPPNFRRTGLRALHTPEALSEFLQLPALPKCFDLIVLPVANARSAELYATGVEQTRICEQALA